MTGSTPNQIPNLAEPRALITEANPQGVGVFFAITKAAINSHRWSREEFEAVKLVEGQLNELEAYFEGVRTKAQQAPIPAAPVNHAAPVAPPAIVNDAAPTPANSVPVPGTPAPTPEVEQEKKN